MDFVPLNVHSYYSFLDSTLSIEAIIELAKRHELPAIALTDKNNLHGAVQFVQLAAKAGIKPIIGAEVELAGKRTCLYVQNQAGYRNLCRILSPKSKVQSPKSDANRAHDSDRASRSSSQQNMDARSRTRLPTDESRRTEGSNDFGPWTLDLGLPTAGLIAVSPSPDLGPLFPDRFYLEISSLDALEKLTHHASRITASFPIHYAAPSDRWKYDIVQSIRTLTLLRQQHPEKRLEGEYHFRSPAEMQRLFSTHPELLRNSLEIAERCSFEFSLGTPQFPSYDPPDGLTPAVYLRQLVMEGLLRRYPKDHARLKPQLEEELAIITEVGYEEYFLVMWDILQECRRRGIEWITRGSAADSLACYCLEISGVCPIRFDLYFRRFLNKDRMALNKLPDIDVDFAHDRKDDVVDLIFEKFGSAKTAIVGGFSTFQSRSAFAEVAKVLGVSEFQVRRITERLPHFSRASELKQTVTESLECRDLPLEEEPYRSALQMAHCLDGFPRYAKMHPCGLVLSRQPMHELVPCFTSAKGYPTTHFDMDSVEAIGLVKMDILAQGGLAVMRDVQEGLNRLNKLNGLNEGEGEGNPKSEIRNPKEARNPNLDTRSPETALPLPHELSCSSPSPREERAGRGSGRGVSCAADTGKTPSSSDFELQNSFGFHHSDFGFPLAPPNLAALEPWDDPLVWQLIASGNARAVHHIESPAMISLCKMCDVRDIDTLIAIVSVIRPGAANESKKMEFARRYQGRSPAQYPHPSLESCLRSTYGLVVYEEHILQICEAFAGLPPGRADVLRRALSKDKTEIITQIRAEFADCARSLGRTEADIVKVWELVEGFKGYAFCKAHSTAYGVEAYQSAWLKLNYPALFMAAVLTNSKGFYDPLVYVLECHRLGISLLPPSVNEPGPNFTVARAVNPKPETRNPKESRISKPEIHQEPEAQSSTSDAHSISDFELRNCFGFRVSGFEFSIRVPLTNLKGLTIRTKETILSERTRAPFSSLRDFMARVQPLNEEMEALIRVGAFDDFGKPRTTQYWEFKALVTQDPTSQPALDLQNSPLDRLPSVPLAEPDCLQCLRSEEELLGYPVSGHPLELYPDIAWDTYCPINRLGEHVGQRIVTCGLVIEQRLFHQSTGEPMKFITIADRTGIVETELFARTYRSYGLTTIRYRVLEITATVEPFENGRGYSLRVLRAGRPRLKT